MLVKSTYKTKRKEQGFTLVELLVVILIVGVLAAIAIPAFMNQRQRANDAAVTSDLKNFNVAMADYAIDENRVPVSHGELANLDLQWSWDSIHLKGSSAQRSNLLYCTATENGVRKGEEWLLYIRSQSDRRFITGTVVDGKVEEIFVDSNTPADYCEPYFGENYWARWGYNAGTTIDPPYTTYWAQESYDNWRN